MKGSSKTDMAAKKISKESKAAFLDKRQEIGEIKFWPLKDVVNYKAQLHCNDFRQKLNVFKTMADGDYEKESTTSRYAMERFQADQEKPLPADYSGHESGRNNSTEAVPMSTTSLRQDCLGLELGFDDNLDDNFGVCKSPDENNNGKWHA
jgi:hypothetical protein